MVGGIAVPVGEPTILLSRTGHVRSITMSSVMIHASSILDELAFLGASQSGGGCCRSLVFVCLRCVL